MKKQSPRKNSTALPLEIKIAIPVVVVAAAGIFLASRIGGSAEDASVQANVARLKQMEQADISAAESAWKDLNTVPAEENTKSADEIKESILSGNLLSDVQIRQVFKGTAILGDSITESIWEYGYLDTDVVISQRGMSISSADDLINTAISLNPSVIFMSFGTNDLESYLDNVDGFISGYRVQVQKIKDALPEVPIYINLVLPITDEAINNTPALQYYPQYNEAILTMCQDMELTPIDNAFIVENNEDIYEPDGQHVIASYYPQWLTNMAEMAGLA